jgi:hypothetical protein
VLPGQQGSPAAPHWVQVSGAVGVKHWLVNVLQQEPVVAHDVPQQA